MEYLPPQHHHGTPWLQEPHRPLFFRKLPPEIRTTIFEYVYTDTCIEVKSCIYTAGGSFLPPAQALNRRPRKIFRQLLVSRQWLAESALIFASQIDWGFPHAEALEDFRDTAPGYIALNIRTATLFNPGSLWASPFILETLPGLQHLTITISQSMMRQIMEGDHIPGMAYVLGLNGLRSFKLDVVACMARAHWVELQTLNGYAQIVARQKLRRVVDEVLRTVTRPRDLVCHRRMMSGLNHYGFDRFSQEGQYTEAGVCDQGVWPMVSEFGGMDDIPMVDISGQQY